ncbi:hypothetical protein [Intestinibacter bartlettii]|jgi:hypothetical protein|uniref:Uncharacterized protein n=1 Tax=human gut metagenome TaxID=408170 RepID=W1WLN4_9ZZZZ|nr:hypothetical protein [Intestinibacter bartlettii]MDU1254365.1 hypothetical protein [Peptostreptococcaceae bacterium]MDU2693944.1 hypothetical protein [Intestinibacter bartlettii]MDU6210068.1 hypothetical protein [Clostridium perfringens]
MYNRKIVAQPLEVSRAKIIMKNRRRRRNGGYSNNSCGGGNTYITNNYYYGNECRQEQPQEERGILVSDLVKQYSQEENVHVQEERKPKLNRNYKEDSSNQIDDEVLKEVIRITLRMLRK